MTYMQQYIEIQVCSVRFNSSLCYKLFTFSALAAWRENTAQSG